MLTRCPYLQAMSENQEIVLLLQENQEETDLLADLYNEYKGCLNQARVKRDLERLRAYACLHRVYFAYKLTATP